MLRICLLALLASIISGLRAEAQIMAHVDVFSGPPTWAYTLVNNDAVGSSNYLTAFELLVGAPVVVTGSPDGWDYQTDGSTYVLWFNTDDELPYPHDIAPGETLDGFSLQSPASSSQLKAYSLSSWDHSADLPGAIATGTVSSPFLPAPVPEPDGTVVLGAAIFALLVVVWLYARQRGRSWLWKEGAGVIEPRSSLLYNRANAQLSHSPAPYRLCVADAHRKPCA